MPSKSKSQARLMAAVAHNPEFAKKVGIPVSVGKEFNKADKGRKFKEGGTMATKEMHSEKGEMKQDIAQDKKMIKKAVGMHDKQMHGGKKTDLAKLKKGGMSCMAGGGRLASKGEHAVQKQSKRGAMEVKMAKGGLASGHKSADGCAVRGKTRAMAPAMRKGGKVC